MTLLELMLVIGIVAILLTSAIPSFREMIMNNRRTAAINELVAGKTKNIHSTMLALEKADMSLKLMMQVRNKVLEAYREVMKMQV